MTDRHRYPLGTRVNKDVNAYIRYVAQQQGVNVSKTIENILREHMLAAEAKWKAAQNVQKT